MTENKNSSRRGFSRRGFLVTTGVGVGAFAAGVGTSEAVKAFTGSSSSKSETIPFYGEHQAGIETPLQTSVTYLGWNLKPGSTRVDAQRMMTLLTDDASRLTQGVPALPDNDPYLATNPARLTVTFGFGPGFFSTLGLTNQLPQGFSDLPAFSIDQLQPEFSGGDLLIQIGSDDALTLSHAVRQLTRTARSFADII
jgi:dye decolorizing peroxidase